MGVDKNQHESEASHHDSMEEIEESHNEHSHESVQELSQFSEPSLIQPIFKVEKQEPIQFEVGEHVDCLDSVNKWCNAEVVAKKGSLLKIHFTGWSSKYDETIDQKSTRLQKQWKRGQPIRLNNRLDVRDVKGKWLEALVIQINEDATLMKIHYQRWSSKWDEFIEIGNQAQLVDVKYAEVGLYSSSFGFAKFHKSLFIQQPINTPEIQNDIREQLRLQEERFQRLLAQKNMIIKEIEGDGNCLFRAVSDQVYFGDQEQHFGIRQACMDYLESEKDFFAQFVVGGLDYFDQYVASKRIDGVWGDDLELQALSEIYNRPIEIYAYNNTPLRTFHEEAGNRNFQNHSHLEPIRLSYHGKQHYNSIIKIPDFELSEQMQQNKVGVVEAEALKLSSQRKKKVVKLIEGEEEEKAGREQAVEDMIAKARLEFESKGKRDMEVAMEESLALFQKDIEQEEQAVIAKSEQQYEDEQLVQMAVNQSVADLKEEELQQIQQVQDNNNYEDIVMQALELGFDAEDTVKAISMFGTKADLVLNYLLAQSSYQFLNK